jgi:hypothetical protein
MLEDDGVVDLTAALSLIATLRAEKDEYRCGCAR